MNILLFLDQMAAILEYSTIPYTEACPLLYGFIPYTSNKDLDTKIIILSYLEMKIL